MSCLIAPQEVTTSFTSFKNKAANLIVLPALAPIFQACTGQTLAEDNYDWMKAWGDEKNTCLNTLSDLVNLTHLEGGGVIGFNPTNYEIIQEATTSMLDRFYYKYKMTESGQVGYHYFQTQLLSLCQKIPGACHPWLSQKCQSCNRTQISNSRELSNFCGCYAPTLDVKYQLKDKACDPLCVRLASVKLPLIEKDSFGRPHLDNQRCQAAICVLSDLELNLQDSQIHDGLVFQQICTACRDNPGNCKCIISGADIGNLLASLGMNDQISLQQYCPGATCLQVDINTLQVMEKDCLSQIKPFKTSEVKTQMPWTWLIVIALLTLVMCLVLLSAALGQKERNLIYPSPAIEARGHLPPGFKFSILLAN